MTFYWHRYNREDGLLVTYPGLSSHGKANRWLGIFGLQIGPWFFGAIKGEPTDLGRSALSETIGGTSK